METVLFFDIDGTTVDTFHYQKEMYPETKAAIAEAQAKGSRAFVATGRAQCFMIEDVKTYPFDGFVTCNGAYVEYQGQVVYQKVIPKEVIQITRKVCQRHGIPYFLESRDCIYVSDLNDQRVIRFAREWHMKEEIMRRDAEWQESDIYIAMAIMETEEKLAVLKQELGEYYTITKHPSQVSCDLTQRGVSKAVGIQEFLRYLGIPIEQTYAFGDAGNDLEMLEVVGTGICMGNGEPEVKERADYITEPIWENGIGKALKHFGLVS